MQKYFESFMFEELTTKNITAEDAYLSEALSSEIYFGIIGEHYGYEDVDVILSTEREYVVATDVGGTAEAVNEENGFLIPAEFDNVDVAKKISAYLSLSDEEKLSYRRRAYEFWRDNYEAGKNYADFLRLIVE